jgi:citron Rho-interacting kinase
VVLTREKSTGDVFAMKIMKKAHILQQPDVRLSMQGKCYQNCWLAIGVQAAFYSAERDIMAWSTSPWLTALHYAFQDPTSLYLVMDYHPGGDLLNIMEKKEGSMQEEEAKYVFL